VRPHRRQEEKRGRGVCLFVCLLTYNQRSWQTAGVATTQDNTTGLRGKKTRGGGRRTSDKRVRTEGGDRYSRCLQSGSTSFFFLYQNNECIGHMTDKRLPFRTLRTLPFIHSVILRSFVTFLLPSLFNTHLLSSFDTSEEQHRSDPCNAPHLLSPCLFLLPPTCHCHSVRIACIYLPFCMGPCSDGCTYRQSRSFLPVCACLFGTNDKRRPTPFSPLLPCTSECEHNPFRAGREGNTHA